MSRQRWRKNYEQPSRFNNYAKGTRSHYNSELYNARIIQRNLVYVIGLAPEISTERILKNSKYFGQYGKIDKVVVKNDKPFNPRGINGPTYSAYITFTSDKEASLAILAVDEFELHERIIKASYGTTKYCTFFLRNQSCPNRDCLYLHKKAKQSDCFPKDLVGNKAIFREQQQSVLGHLSKYAKDLFKTKFKNDPKAVFPTIETALEKLKLYCEENEINFGLKRKAVKTLSNLAQWDIAEEDKSNTEPAPIREPILLKKKSTKKKGRKGKRRGGASKDVSLTQSRGVSKQNGCSQCASVDTENKGKSAEVNRAETPRASKEADKSKVICSEPTKTSLKKSKSEEERALGCENATRKFSLSSVIPENLIENFSPLDKLLLSKFQTVSDSTSSSSHQESCLKIVSLIKNFLVEEQKSEEKKRKDEEEIEQEQEPEKERGRSEGRSRDQGFQLFNQNYVLRIERADTRLNQIKLGRTKSTNYKGMKERDDINNKNAKEKTRVQPDAPYSHKSK